MKSRFKILLALILALASGFILLSLLHARSRRAVADYKQQLRAKGEKLLISELAPISLPNPSNGAPAFKAVMQHFPGSSNYPTAMAMVAPGLARIGYTNLSPGLMLEYTQNVHATLELRKALNATVFDFHLDYSLGFALPLDNLAALKKAELLASATAVEALQAGDFSEAHADLLVGADLVRLFNNEPLLISGLVRAAMARLALCATWEALQVEQWTDRELSELQTRWQDMDLFVAAEPALCAVSI